MPSVTVSVNSGPGAKASLPPSTPRPEAACFRSVSLRMEVTDLNSRPFFTVTF